MLITIPTKKGRRIIFESSRVSYLFLMVMHNLYLKLFPPKNTYTYKGDFLYNLPTHCRVDDSKDLITYSLDGHYIGLWDKYKNIGIIELHWSKSFIELYYKLHDLQRRYP